MSTTILDIFSPQLTNSRLLTGIAPGLGVGCQLFIGHSPFSFLHCRVCRVVFDYTLPQIESGVNSFCGKNPPAGSKACGRVNAHDVHEVGFEAGPAVTVSKGIPPPTSASEPCMSLSISHGSLPHEPFVIQVLYWE